MRGTADIPWAGIGGKMADLCIITADNPRFEKNGDIIKDIEVGLAKTDGKYIVIPDRQEAIFTRSTTLRKAT